MILWAMMGDPHTRSSFRDQENLALYEFYGNGCAIHRVAIGEQEIIETRLQGTLRIKPLHQFRRGVGGEERLRSPLVGPRRNRS
jgi:hypothetical protein